MAKKDQQKRHHVRQFLGNPENRKMSASRIAKETGISRTVVADVITELKDEGVAFGDSQGSDGKAYPRSKEARERRRKARANKQALQAKEKAESPKGRNRAARKYMVDLFGLAENAIREDDTLPENALDSIHKEVCSKFGNNAPSLAEIKRLWQERQDWAGQQPKVTCTRTTKPKFGDGPGWMMPERITFPQEREKQRDFVAQQLARIHSFCAQIPVEFGSAEEMLKAWQDISDDDVNPWLLAFESFKKRYEEIEAFRQSMP